MRQVLRRDRVLGRGHRLDRGSGLLHDGDLGLGLRRLRRRGRSRLRDRHVGRGLGRRRGGFVLGDLRGDRLGRLRVQVRAGNLDALDQLGLEREADPLGVQHGDRAGADQDRRGGSARDEPQDAARARRSLRDHDGLGLLLGLELGIGVLRRLALFVEGGELVLVLDLLVARELVVVLELDLLRVLGLERLVLAVDFVGLGLDLLAFRVDSAAVVLERIRRRGIATVRGQRFPTVLDRLLAFGVAFARDARGVGLGALVEHEDLAVQQVVLRGLQRFDLLFLRRRIVLEDDVVVRGLGLRAVDQFEFLLAVDRELVVRLHVAGLGRHRHPHLVRRHRAAAPARTACLVERLRIPVFEALLRRRRREEDVLGRLVRLLRIGGRLLHVRSKIQILLRLGLRLRLRGVLRSSLWAGRLLPTLREHRVEAAALARKAGGVGVLAVLVDVRVVAVHGTLRGAGGSADLSAESPLGGERIRGAPRPTPARGNRPLASALPPTLSSRP